MSDDFAWNQFCKLGEMIGDGLHHEEPWISKEYKRYAKLLMPDVYTDQRKLKNKRIDIAVEKRLKIDRCHKCKGNMKQSRSGSYIINCIKCGARFKYKTVKK